MRTKRPRTTRGLLPYSVCVRLLRRRGCWSGRRFLLRRLLGWRLTGGRSTGLGLTAISRLAALSLVLLGLSGLVGELYLPLTDHFHQLLARFLIFCVVNRWTVIGLGKPRQRNRKPDRLLLQVDRGND